MYKFAGGKLLRFGYTTGTCAAAAAKAAAIMLLGRGRDPLKNVDVITPAGKGLCLALEDVRKGEGWVSCAVRKDSGDDPDVTNGILVYAKVEKMLAPRRGIVVEGGEGIGRVTKPGLDQQVGETAINSMPRKMITAECRAACQDAGYEGALLATISIPAGITLAARTFNPKLGILGGISVLGTSGLVEPMSEKALADSIRIELGQIYEEGERDVLLVIGNAAADFALNNLGLSGIPRVKCSNFIGEALAAASELGFKRVLLVGHLGKIIKLGLGMVNTHSSQGDGRMETLVACALEAGAEIETLKGIAGCVNTSAAAALLNKAGLLRAAMAVLEKRISETLHRHTLDETETGFFSFCKTEASRETPVPADMLRGGEIIAQSANAENMLWVLRNR
jgi:cobalt-precorrin-5B (C1)-methyltransferase